MDRALAFMFGAFAVISGVILAIEATGWLLLGNAVSKEIAADFGQWMAIYYLLAREFARDAASKEPADGH